MYVDDIGLASDHVMQVHMVFNESRQDSKKSRLVLDQISVSSGSGRALGFELDVEQLRTFGRIRQGLRCFLNRRRVAGWGTGRPDGPCDLFGPPQTETLSLFHCVHRFARKIYHRREPLWISARAELEAFVGVMILMESDRAMPWLSGVLTE